MKSILLFIITLTIVSVQAQVKNNWIGGTPGRSNSWDEPKNWSKGSVPNEFSFVVIKSLDNGHCAQPEMKSEVAIAGLEIHAGAQLVILDSGKLTIDGEFTFTDGIKIYGGTLVNNGLINLQNINYNSDSNLVSNIDGKGKCIINGIPNNNDNTPVIHNLASVTKL